MSLRCYGIKLKTDGKSCLIPAHTNPFFDFFSVFDTNSRKAGLSTGPIRYSLWNYSNSKAVIVLSGLFTLIGTIWNNTKALPDQINLNEE